MNIRALEAAEIEAVIPLLLLAEPSLGALRWSLSHLSDRVYGLEIDGAWMVAATMRWQSDPCEILELGVAADHQGQGLGKQLVTWLLAEAQRLGKKSMVVGTSNASTGNFIFYQKCGFRMDHVRHDYFWYDRKPRYENGIRVRDLLVFRHDFGKAKSEDEG